MMLFHCNKEFGNEPLTLNLDYMVSLQESPKGPGSDITMLSDMDCYRITQTPAEVLAFLKGQRP